MQKRIIYSWRYCTWFSAV